MHKLLAITIIMIPTIVLCDEIVRECNEVLIDEVTEMAFADQGQPFTGKVECYYDNEKNKLKSVRTFVNGIPTGTHSCYRWDGEFGYSIIYDKGKRFKKGLSLKTNIARVRV